MPRVRLHWIAIRDDSSVVPGAVKDVQNFHTIGTFSIEDQVVAVDPPAHTPRAATVKVWIGCWPTPDIEARPFEFFYKCIRTGWVVLGNPFGDPF